MQPLSHFDECRLDSIRQANRRRPVAVVDVSRLTPHMQRVTLKELEPDTTDGAEPAEWIKLYVPLSGKGRTHGRAYTVRERAGGTIILDIAVHGGLCASWAQQARPGDRAEISGPRKGFRLARPPSDVLLRQMRPAFLAVAKIIAGLPPDASGAVWLEVPDDSDVLPLDVPRRVAVRYLPRKATPPSKLSASLRDG